MKSKVNNKKILAVDFGEKNIGLAVTDAGAGMVFGNGEIRGKKSLDDIFKAIVKIIIAENVVKVVFGVPVSKEGMDSGQAERMENIGKKLADYIEGPCQGVKLVFQDESFSSFEAREFIREAGVGDFGRKHSEHEIAAMIILKKHLEAGDKEKAQ